MEENGGFSSPEELFNHLAKKFADKFRMMGDALQPETLVIRSKMTEEELVQVLSEIPTKEAGLDFFLDIGSKMLEAESYELLKIIKTHIEYNFDVELKTVGGVSKYEIRKRP